MRHEAKTLVVVGGLALAWAVAGGAAEPGGRPVTGGAVDAAVVFGPAPSGDVTLVVRQFTTANADCGTGDDPEKVKAHEAAQNMKAAAPITLAQTLVTHLKQRPGFSNVVLDDAGSAPEGGLILDGVTTLNPGSRGKRFWVGMGAGRSRVCVKGRVVDAAGPVLLTFDHCRVGTGAWTLAGGKPEGMMFNDISGTAERISTVLAQWKNGAYSK